MLINFIEIRFKKIIGLLKVKRWYLDFTRM